jgi:hypothetical protein
MITSFWPEKATEWIALIGGGAVGPLAFAISILGYRRDRAVLMFAASEEEYFDTGEPETLDASIYDDKTVFRLQVTNRGRRPVRIQSVGLRLYDLPVVLLLNPERKSDDSMGILLTESGASASYVTEPFKIGEATLRDFMRFEICDSAYREYHHYHRGYLRTQFARHRMRLQERERYRNMEPPRSVTSLSDTDHDS